MSFLDRLQPASFKGVLFFVDATSATKGRRVTNQRIAGRDGSSPQDHGKEPLEVDIQAFVFGQEYDVARDALEDALVEDGPGELRIPSRKAIWARVTRGPRTEERKGELGYCSISFSVVEEEREAAASATVDTAADVEAKAATVTAVATDDFEDSYDAVLPAQYLTKAVSAVQYCSTVLKRIDGKISGALNPLEDLQASIDELRDAAAELASAPARLAAEIVGITGAVHAAATTTTAAIDRLTGLASVEESPYDKAQSARVMAQAARATQALGADGSTAYPAPAPDTGTSEQRQQESANVRAIYRLQRATALAAQCDVYASASFDSSALALSTLTSVRVEIDALQQFTCGDALFDALADLRASVVAHLVQTAVDLPSTSTYEQHPPIPALVLAHQLYGDARRESEIVARNRPKYPGGIEGSVEVLDV